MRFCFIFLAVFSVSWAIALPPQWPDEHVHHEEQVISTPDQKARVNVAVDQKPVVARVITPDIDRANNITHAEIDTMRAKNQANLDNMKARIDDMKVETDKKADALKDIANKTADNAKSETSAAVLVHNKTTMVEQEKPNARVIDKTTMVEDEKPHARVINNNAPVENVVPVPAPVVKEPVLKSHEKPVVEPAHEKPVPVVEEERPVKNVTVVEQPKPVVKEERPEPVVERPTGQLVVNNTAEAGKTLDKSAKFANVSDAVVASPAVHATKGGGVELKDAVVGGTRRVNDLAAHPGPMILANKSEHVAQPVSAPVHHDEKEVVNV